MQLTPPPAGVLNEDWWAPFRAFAGAREKDFHVVGRIERAGKPPVTVYEHNAIDHTLDLGPAGETSRFSNGRLARRPAERLPTTDRIVRRGNVVVRVLDGGRA